LHLPADRYVFGWLLSEASFQFLDDKESVQRDPHRVELVIPTEPQNW
jgi:hypothetical protein